MYPFSHFTPVQPLKTHSVLTFKFNEFKEIFWPETEHDAKHKTFNMQTGVPFEL